MITSFVVAIAVVVVVVVGICLIDLEYKDIPFHNTSQIYFIFSNGYDFFIISPSQVSNADTLKASSNAASTCNLANFINIVSLSVEEFLLRNSFAVGISIY
jgi:hypothetical protein